MTPEDEKLINELIKISKTRNNIVHNEFLVYEKDPFDYEYNVKRHFSLKAEILLLDKIIEVLKNKFQLSE